jgi:hypothetical protein
MRSLTDALSGTWFAHCIPECCHFGRGGAAMTAYVRCNRKGGAVSAGRTRVWWIWHAPTQRDLEKADCHRRCSHDAMSERVPSLRAAHKLAHHPPVVTRREPPVMIETR